jgi:hypothetical protein
MYFLCVNMYCHRVTTQLQLNKHIISHVSTHPSVHHLEDFYMQFYGIVLIHPYPKHPAINQTAYKDA